MTPFLFFIFAIFGAIVAIVLAVMFAWVLLLVIVVIALLSFPQPTLIVLASFLASGLVCKLIYKLKGDKFGGER